MLQQSIPAARAADAALLSEQIKRFIRAGGKVEKVASFEQKPRPPHVDAPPGRKLVTQLRLYAKKGYSRRYAAMCLNISDWKAYDISRNNGIQWRSDPSKHYKV
jgi:hypothetical protein